MPAYLVELPNVPGLSNVVGGTAMVVFASDADDAKAAADAHFGQDTQGLFTAIGTATEIVAGANLSDYALHIRIYDASPVIDVEAEAGSAIVGAATVAIQAGGTGYTDGDVLTVGGGTLATNGHAARLRVTSVNVGVVDGIELVDPGTYSALPANPVAVTGGTGGNNATFNLTSNGGVSLAALLARAVDLLNLTAIDGATVDLGEAAQGATDLTFTVATGGGGDDLGDKNMVVEVVKNGVAIPSLVGAVTDGGVATAALKFAIPAAAARINPNVLSVLNR